MVKEYKHLIDTFDKLHTGDKRKELMNEMQELLTVFQMLNINKGKKPNLLLHPTMNDYKKEHSENEFLNAMYSYVISTKELVGEYFEE